MSLARTPLTRSLRTDSGSTTLCPTVRCTDCESLRADTHADNKVMQHLLESEGFTRCGIIHVEDGTPRIAYQRLSLTQSQLG